MNPWAVVALVIGVGCALLGRFIPPVRWLYDYAWFVGFFVSGGLYAVLMRGSAVPVPVTEFAGEEA